jgi:tetratricopeptide (TPR) repeat protein
MVGSKASISRQRLDSWKEIAAFFGRDERTVNRWEKELGMPVHRLPGAKGRVYAYTDELSDWLAAPRNAGAMSPEDDPASPPDSETPMARLTVINGGRALSDVAPPVTILSEAMPTPATARSAARSRKAGWLVAAALIIVAALALMLFRYPNPASDERKGAAEIEQGSSGGSVQASSHARDPEAEQLYLKGRYYWNKRTPDDLNKAVDYFVQAIVHDPNYAMAYVGLADCYNLLREYTAMPAAEAYPRAFAAAKKAVELDDHSSAAHASLAFALFFGRWDIANAEAEFRRAIDLDPNNAIAHHWYANYLLTVRRFPESLAEIEKAQSLDPASTSILADKGNILFYAGRQDEAIALLKQMEVTEPAFRSPHLYLKGIYLNVADYPDFLAESRKDALAVQDNSALAITTVAEKGFAAGGAKAMFENMLQVQKKYLAHKLVSPVLVAETCARLKNKSAALQYLKAAFDQRDELLLPIKNDPAFDSLHDDAAYRDLLERMNLPAGN